ncbi:histidine--tRNA ligase [Mogibacterium diversum]|jgi:histidine--tRNA ligase|uniref:histidine--tRNA ligase n=1 Tax=Mogibacterium diversum TaxID=114527 RepID=UPI001CB4C293|nr:histidine--tRNA ligase [Mogibacterium diversum]MBF1319393.1 histidine--tRNA ligase [Mogibacterium diversum]MBF1331669.1 histidine--tRNA ligase [Mogibacterium diversum]MBF1361485.1 histidine--tRNA ligase [Mogibacterium diversum]
MAIKAPKGTKDTMPRDSYKVQYIEKEFSELCRLYGFGEVRTPMFESTELFNRGVGETTDIVQKEMYTFEDLGHRSITLKPEGTSPAVRAFIESHDYAEMQPTKYYYDTPCFRYERPQAGRLREFHQFGVENFGTPDMMADAEVIALASDFIKKIGIEDVELRINSVGCRECRPVYRKALQDYLRPYYEDLSDISKDRFEANPMRIIDSKDITDQRIAKDAPYMLDYLCDDCKAAFEALKTNLDAMGISYVVDPRIVRGLDYYTKTAFEFVTTKIGAQGTVCGGGRYDHLVEEIGGPSIPGVGFGLGKERLLILMEQNDIIVDDPNVPDISVSFIGDKARLYALDLVHKLRACGVSAIIDTLNRNLKGQMKYANKLNARYSVVIGENEIEKGIVTLKNMNSGEQKEINAIDITKEIEK